MEAGDLLSTGRFGPRVLRHQTGHRIATVIGLTWMTTMVGRGLVVSRGDGLLITTEDGSTTVDMDGPGGLAKWTPAFIGAPPWWDSSALASAWPPESDGRLWRHLKFVIPGGGVEATALETDLAVDLATIGTGLILPEVTSLGSTETPASAEEL